MLERERAGKDGERPLKTELARQKGLDSPFYLASEIVDPFYRENFEPGMHSQLLDECLAPWVLGETVRVEGSNYDPKDFVGLIVLWPRGTFKSSCLRLLLLWAYLYFKLRLNEDLTCMLVHAVQTKAIDHGESIRNTAKFNMEFREYYSEFAVQPDKEWDRKDIWSWPNVTAQTRQAKLWSWVAYGETSSKVGGHYKLRLVDDWEDETTVTSPEMIMNSEKRFKQFDNLGVRGRPHNPWIVMGTYYHYDGTYKRLERSGGWLPWVVPAHEGSTKEIFDLVSLDRREPAQLKQINSGLKKLETERQEDLNFPKLYPWRELYKAALGQRTDDDGELRGGFYEYSCQILLNPVPQGQTRFDYDALQAAWVDQLPSPDEVYLYVRIDPALGQRRRLSETALVLGAVRWDKHRFILQSQLVQEKRPVVILRRAFQWVRNWQDLGYEVKGIGIEKVAFQEAMATQARDGVPERDAAYEGEPIPAMFPPCPMQLIPRGPTVSKDERQLSLDGPIARRELHFWVKDPGGKKLWTQFIQYPHGKKDGIDAVHDLWMHTQVPPQPLETKAPEQISPEEILARLGMAPKPGVRMGLTNEVRLTSWR